MTHGSLFAGIGGFDYAAKLAGIETVWQVEIDGYCLKVLEKNFPDVKRYENIKKIKGEELERVDIISGGIPCQPVSHAGKRKGKEDDRWLWDEMLRIISKVKPSWCIAENVYGLITQEKGMVFEQVLSDLENEGYEVQPFIIPACAVNAPHKRKRVWIVAYNNSIMRNWERCKSKSKESEKYKVVATNKNVANSDRTRELQQKRIKQDIGGWSSNKDKDVADTNGKHKQEYSERDKLGYKREKGAFGRSIYETDWDKDWVEVATELCRVDARISNRVDRIRCLGNAIVPQIAYEIFKIIKYVNNMSE